MQRTTLTLGLGVAAVAAVALAPRLSGLLREPRVTAIATEPVTAPVVVAPAVAQVQPTPVSPRPVAPVPVVRPRAIANGPIPEVDEPLPEPAKVPVDDGVIPMKTGGQGHVDTLPELDQPKPIPPEIVWDDCPACGMG